MAPSKPKPRPPQRKTSRDGESNQQKRLTSERITADLESFEQAGGRVEVLGTTRVLKKVDEMLAGAATPGQKAVPDSGTD